MGLKTIIPQKNTKVKAEKKKHHLTEYDRIRIEVLRKAKHSNKEIALFIGCSERTIRREIARGWCKQRSYEVNYFYTYAADKGQRICNEKSKNKGRYSKISNLHELRIYIERKILSEHYSPEAALESAKKENIPGALDISVKTLYNSIDSGEMRVCRNDLLRRGWKKKAKDENKGKIAGNNRKGRSIEERPEKVNNRQEFGHWEIDLVVGKKGSLPCLLTLTERMSRKEIIIKLKNKSQKSVINAINKLEKSYGKKFKEIFKTVTADNGSEFLDFNSLETSIYGGKRFTMYFAHPYSSFERGTNENANGIIRRFLPKGTDFSAVSNKKVKNIQSWMNTYPRKILGWRSPNEFMENLGLHQF